MFPLATFLYKHKKIILTKMELYYQSTIINLCLKFKNYQKLTLPHPKITVYFVFFLTLSAITTNAAVDPIKKPVWLTASCYKLHFSAWDKFNIYQEYTITYVVKNKHFTFVVKKNVKDTTEPPTEVVFPDDFIDHNTNTRAWVSCEGNEKFAWEIYINNTKIDSGIFKASNISNN